MSRHTAPHPDDTRAEQRLARWAALTPDERAERVATAKRRRILEGIIRASLIGVTLRSDAALRP